MEMPETTVYEDDLSSRFEYNVRLSWQRPVVEAISVSHRVDEPSDLQLGLSIRVLD